MCVFQFFTLLWPISSLLLSLAPSDPLAKPQLFSSARISLGCPRAVPGTGLDPSLLSSGGAAVFEEQAGDSQPCGAPFPHSPHCSLPLPSSIALSSGK